MLGNIQPSIEVRNHFELRETGTIRKTAQLSHFPTIAACPLSAKHKTMCIAMQLPRT